MNAVVERISQPTTVAAADTQALITAIERAASNPRINLDKMDRLLAMQERILTQQREAQFNTAMAAAQAEMERVATDARNSQTHSLYATYAAIDRALRPIYTKHGFGLSFDEADCPKPECMRVICLVTHVGGYSRLYHRDMPADGKGAKGGDVMTKTHAVGSAQTYGMRYLIKGIFNVAIGIDPEDMDDDGNAAGGPIQGAHGAAGRPALTYDQTKFNSNFAKWSQLIQSGRRTAADVIITVEAAAPLSGEQKKRINDIKPAGGK